MEISRKSKGSRSDAAIIGVAVVACAGCCAPLVIPALTSLLAWAGLATVAEASHYWLVGAVALSGLVALAMMALRHRRRPGSSAACQAQPCANGCAGSGVTLRSPAPARNDDGHAQ
jgi:hypothetical protein